MARCELFSVVLNRTILTSCSVVVTIVEFQTVLARTLRRTVRASTLCTTSTFAKSRSSRSRNLTVCLMIVMIILIASGRHSNFYCIAATARCYHPTYLVIDCRAAVQLLQKSQILPLQVRSQPSNNGGGSFSSDFGPFSGFEIGIIMIDDVTLWSKLESRPTW